MAVRESKTKTLNTLKEDVSTMKEEQVRLSSVTDQLVQWVKTHRNINTALKTINEDVVNLTAKVLITETKQAKILEAMGNASNKHSLLMKWIRENLGQNLEHINDKIVTATQTLKSEQLKDFKAMIESENKCSALRQKKERLTEWSSQRQELEESFSSKLEQLSAATTLRFKTNDAALDHKLALVKAEIRKQAEAKQAETTEIARRAALATGEAAKLGQEKLLTAVGSMLVKEREAMKEFVKVSIDEMKMEIMKSISNELLVTVQKYADNHEKVFQIEKEQAKIQSDILELRSFLIKIKSEAELQNVDIVALKTKNMDEIFERLDTIEESLKKQNLLQENVKDNSTLPTIKNILEQLHFDQYIENFARAGYSTNESCDIITDMLLAQVGVELRGHRKVILGEIQKACDVQSKSKKQRFAETPEALKQKESILLKRKQEESELALKKEEQARSASLRNEQIEVEKQLCASREKELSAKLNSALDNELEAKVIETKKGEITDKEGEINLSGELAQLNAASEKLKKDIDELFVNPPTDVSKTVEGQVEDASSDDTEAAELLAKKQELEKELAQAESSLKANDNKFQAKMQEEQNELEKQLDEAKAAQLKEEEELKARQEEERLRQEQLVKQQKEEQERREQERKERELKKREEQARLEREKREQEEAEKRERERIEKEKQEKEQKRRAEEQELEKKRKEELEKKQREEELERKKKEQTQEKRRKEKEEQKRKEQEEQEKRRKEQEEQRKREENIRTASKNEDDRRRKEEEARNEIALKAKLQREKEEKEKKEKEAAASHENVQQQKKPIDDDDSWGDDDDDDDDDEPTGYNFAVRAAIYGGRVQTMQTTTPKQSYQYYQSQEPQQQSQQQSQFVSQQSQSQSQSYSSPQQQSHQQSTEVSSRKLTVSTQGKSVAQGSSVDTTDPEMNQVLNDIRQEAETNWMIMGYNKTKDILSLYDSGTGGFSEFMSALSGLDGTEVLYGYFRVVYGENEQSKFVFVTLVPDSLTGMAKAKANMHRRDIESFVQSFHTSFNLTTAELDEETLYNRLESVGGANYGNGKPRTSQHQITQKAQGTGQKRGSSVSSAKTAQQPPAAAGAGAAKPPQEAGAPQKPLLADAQQTYYPPGTLPVKPQRDGDDALKKLIAGERGKAHEFAAKLSAPKTADVAAPKSAESEQGKPKPEAPKQSQGRSAASFVLDIAPECADLLSDVRSETGSHDWMVLGYDSGTSRLVVVASGNGGMDEFFDELRAMDGKSILYCYLRVHYGELKQAKFVMITLVPDTMTGMAKARANMHKLHVAKFFISSHTSFDIATSSEISQDDVLERLKSVSAFANTERASGTSAKHSAPKAAQQAASTKTTVQKAQQSSVPKPQPHAAPKPAVKQTVSTTSQQSAENAGGNDDDSWLTEDESTPTKSQQKAQQKQAGFSFDDDDDDIFDGEGGHVMSYDELKSVANKNGVTDILTALSHLRKTGVVACPQPAAMKGDDLIVLIKKI